MDGEGVTVRFLLPEKTLLARVEGVFDDRLLILAVTRVVKHPDFNRCERRLVDLRACRRGRVSFDAVRQAFMLARTHSHADVEVTVLMGADLEHIQHVLEAQAWSLPFVLRFTRDERIIERLEPDVATSAMQVNEHLVATTIAAQDVLARIESKTSAFELSFLKEVEGSLAALTPELRDLYAEAQHTRAEGQFGSASAKIREMLRRLAEGTPEANLHDAIISSASTGELTKHLAPLIRTHERALTPAAIDDVDHEKVLWGIVSTLLVYRVLLPHWVTELLSHAPPV